jgi:hypothetical protein
MRVNGRELSVECGWRNESIHGIIGSGDVWTRYLRKKVGRRRIDVTGSPAALRVPDRHGSVLEYLIEGPVTWPSSELGEPSRAPWRLHEL